jgi:SAM-dependent methyltransferase
MSAAQRGAGPLQRWIESYRTGHTPWDSGITPPEVIEYWLAAAVQPGGRALDLGCGTGTNVRFLATLGLTVVGVDFVKDALEIASARLQDAPPALRQQIALVTGDVSALPLVGGNFDYILDIGCFHMLHPHDRPSYVAGVLANLASGGHYHLYGFDRSAELADDAERWFRGFTDTEVVDLFAPELSPVEIRRARPDRAPCRWYLFQRL